MQRKTIRSETKVVDERLGKVHAVVSDETKDRDGDVIRQAHWNLDEFSKHPVLVASHNYFDLKAQIGEWEDLEVKGNTLQGVARYMVGQGNEQADWGFTLAANGRAAYSVGFIPDMDKAKDLSGGGLEFNGQRLLEVSHVVVPSNPNALQAMKMLKDYKVLDPVISEMVDEVLEVAEEVSIDDAKALAETLIPYLAEHFELRVRESGLTEVVTESFGPVPSHTTGVASGIVWDAYANFVKMASADSEFFAWKGTDGNMGLHHFVNNDGSIGRASLEACGIIMDALADDNQTYIPDRDRQGVINHLMRHIQDGNEVPRVGTSNNSILEAVRQWI